MTVLPQQNCVLITVSGGGTTEDYATVAGSVTAKWTGNVGSYVSRKTRVAFNASGSLNRVTEIHLIIPGDMGPEFSLQSGDVVTWTQFNPVDQSTVTYTGKVQGYVTPANLTSLPNYVDITLENVRAVAPTI